MAIKPSSKVVVKKIAPAPPAEDAAEAESAVEAEGAGEAEGAVEAEGAGEAEEAAPAPAPRKVIKKIAVAPAKPAVAAKPAAKPAVAAKPAAKPAVAAKPAAKPAGKVVVAKPAAKPAGKAAPARKGSGIVLGGKAASGQTFDYEVAGVKLSVSGELPAAEGDRMARDIMVNIVHEYLTKKGLNPESKKLTADIVSAVEDVLVEITGDYSLKFMGNMFKRVFIGARYFRSIIEGAPSSFMPDHYRSKYDRNVDGVKSLRGELDTDGNFVATEEVAEAEE